MRSVDTVVHIHALDIVSEIVGTVARGPVAAGASPVLLKDASANEGEDREEIEKHVVLVLVKI